MHMQLPRWLRFHISLNPPNLSQKLTNYSIKPGRFQQFSTLQNFITNSSINPPIQHILIHYFSWLEIMHHSTSKTANNSHIQSNKNMQESFYTSLAQIKAKIRFTYLECVISPPFAKSLFLLELDHIKTIRI